MTDQQARLRLVELRREAAEIIALIDTTEMPPPTNLEGTGHLPGPMWEVDRGQKLRPWTVHVVKGEPDAVFIGHPESFGDVYAATIEEARRLAMAILASCAWQDAHRRPAVLQQASRP